MDFPPLVDAYNRKIGSVRFSLTDRCNLRCQYCMPEDGINWVQRSEILKFEEILRLAKIFYRTGVKKFRITGGEPTVRQGITNFIRLFKEELPETDLAMTTNGINLQSMASDLQKAGLDRLNISLDTLNHDKFREITRRDQFQAVMNGISTANEMDFKEIKINAVSIKDFNDDEESLKEFIKFSEDNGIEIRFIELMPFTGNNWKDQGFVSAEDLRQKLEKFGNLIQLKTIDKSSTSTKWKINNASVGFIASVTESFCQTCDRLRITAEGKLRPCLHNKKEYDLKKSLRNDASDDEILEIIREGLKEKWKEHPDFRLLQYKPPIDDRAMIKIGG